MCAARSGEVRGMTWGELEFQKRDMATCDTCDMATWTIPADRMKMGKEHAIEAFGRHVRDFSRTWASPLEL
jgi:integrase